MNIKRDHGKRARVYMQEGGDKSIEHDFKLEQLAIKGPAVEAASGSTKAELFGEDLSGISTHLETRRLSYHSPQYKSFLKSCSMEFWSCSGGGRSFQVFMAVLLAVALALAPNG